MSSHTSKAWYLGTKPNPLVASDDKIVDDVMTSTTAGVLFKASLRAFSSFSGSSTLTP